ncbi:MAG: hypothetical protein Q4B54_11835, partial [Coriobacteriales bacterium]|nr:hypothetical protein [Coriobacteriales bacterium]
GPAQGSAAADLGAADVNTGLTEQKRYISPAEQASASPSREFIVVPSRADAIILVRHCKTRSTQFLSTFKQ